MMQIHGFYRVSENSDGSTFLIMIGMCIHISLFFYTSVDIGLIVYVVENELALWIRPRIQGIGHDKEQKNQ